MGTTLSELTVFISCPGDLGELRGIAEQAIIEVSHSLRVTNRCVLTALLWDQNVIPGVGTDGQQVINAQTTGRYDIYLGFMGAKFGSPTPRAGSGTEEEFDLAVETFENNPTGVRIMFYLQGFGVNPFAINPTQLEKVQSFKRKLEAKGVLYKQLNTVDDAARSVKGHLLKLVAEEWDVENNRWRDVKKTNSEIEPRRALQQVACDQGLERISKAGVEAEELGLLELLAVGTEELEMSAVPVAQLGSNMEELTRITQDVFVGPFGGPKEFIDAVDGYSKAIDSFIQKSRGEMANVKYHIDRGAGLLEDYFAQSKSLELPTADQVTGVLQSLDQVEPSTKAFRSAMMDAKRAALGMPPMTRKLILSKRRLGDFFDEVIVDLTSVVERLALLRVRLSGIAG